MTPDRTRTQQATSRAPKTATSNAASHANPLWRRISAAKNALSSVLTRAGDFGTEGYPPDTRRRLKIVNLISGLIAITTFIYAVQLWAAGDPHMTPIVYINLALVFFVSLVPFAHRINDVAGGLLLVAAEFAALAMFTSFFGHAAGAPLQYVVAAAAPFVIYDRKRLPLVIAIVVLAMALHLYSWFTFPPTAASLSVKPEMTNALYVQSAVTTFGLIAAAVYYAFSLVERAKAETETVLRNVLPDSIVERLKSDAGGTIADSFSDASVLFADITGFVGLARSLGAQRTVEVLNKLVIAFDGLAEKHGVEKIKTIGDAYMVASGVPIARADHLEALSRMALDMLHEIKRVAAQEDLALNIRIGMASGPIMAGVIGTKKFSYDIWGDPVNLASRLEGLSEPGRILICPGCHIKLLEKFTFERRGLIEVKGVGQQEAWYLTGERTA